MVCARCGHENAAGSRFCSSCGAALESERDDRTLNLTLDPTADASVESTGAPTSAEALLVVTRGPNSGSRFEIDEERTSLGRHPDSDIFLDDVTVSRRHAEIERVADGYRVRDVGSLNGTYLNRERIEEAALADHDELQVGTFRLVFVTGGES